MTVRTLTGVTLTRPPGDVAGADVVAPAAGNGPVSSPHGDVNGPPGSAALDGCVTSGLVAVGQHPVLPDGAVDRDGARLGPAETGTGRTYHLEDGFRNSLCH